MKKPLSFLIVILFSCVYLNAQELAVSGKIVDSKGSVLPSTLVVLKSDATYHTTSDKNGKYALNLPSTEKDTLLFLYANYENREIAINNQQIVDVVLTESKIEDKEVTELYSSIKTPKADPIHIPNRYNGDDSIGIRNGYDRKTDFSAEIPNADLKGKKVTIRKSVPELPLNP